MSTRRRDARFRALRGAGLMRTRYRAGGKGGLRQSRFRNLGPLQKTAVTLRALTFHPIGRSGLARIVRVPRVGGG